MSHLFSSHTLFSAFSRYCFKRIRIINHLYYLTNCLPSGFQQVARPQLIRDHTMIYFNNLAEHVMNTHSFQNSIWLTQYSIWYYNQQLQIIDDRLILLESHLKNIDVISFNLVKHNKIHECCTLHAQLRSHKVSKFASALPFPLYMQADHNHQGYGATSQSEQSGKSHEKNPNRTMVVNLSSKTLPPEAISLLDKGLSFCPTPRNLDTEKLTLELNEFYRRVRLREFFTAK